MEELIEVSCKRRKTYSSRGHARASFGVDCGERGPYPKIVSVTLGDADIGCVLKQIENTYPDRIEWDAESRTGLIVVLVDGREEPGERVHYGSMTV
jgi:hypothetical protein